jgi:hypothetical protein
MKTNLDLKNAIGKFKAKPSLVFFSVLVLVILFEVFILYGALRQAFNSRKAPEDLVPTRGVRLNFEGYEQAKKRIETGKEYSPGLPIIGNPFGNR